MVIVFLEDTHYLLALVQRRFSAGRIIGTYDRQKYSTRVKYNRAPGRGRASALKRAVGDGGSRRTSIVERTILRSDARRARGYDFRLAAGTQYCLVKDAAAVFRECSAIQGGRLIAAVM